MNLEKMFKMQAELDNRIIREKGLEGQDLLPGLILALQVELAECANEWRGFKFWSNDQQPRTEKEIECSLCKGTGDMNYERIAEDAEGMGGHEYIKCEECNGEGTTGTNNPLLEEYVDCLHFILSIGNHIKYPSNYNMDILNRAIFYEGGVNAFLAVLYEVSAFYVELKTGGEVSSSFVEIFMRFNALGIALGFTPEQIEQAYMEKNAVNHKRQQEGY
ncbi:dUTP diphosphatase [Bacillus safensis]|uniref:dUTP diphosphatase n=1 Tax=Bacillus safensis TaxID=561879 RepID=UPI00227F1499|nr:dUTP diphosphatase [Bacillus safensis]MCY7446353.1 dUTP diphosphatase [Bacillus safensis]MCY7459162.1 dUTP diphosphatase [Bacillus safensis]